MWSPKNLKMFPTGKCGGTSLSLSSSYDFIHSVDQRGAGLPFALKPSNYSLLFPQTYSGPFESQQLYHMPKSDP